VPSLAEEPRKRAGGRGRKTAPPPWWHGCEDAPHRHWPGITIEIPSVWRSATSRWETPDGQYYFDEASSRYAEGFYPTCLEHHIGEFDGSPFELMPYQQFLAVRPLFGWKRQTDGLRRFRKVFLAVPKGSGKSPFGAGTGLLLAFFDGEPGAEVYAVAADRKQAGIVHDSAKVMVQRNPDLEARCEVFRDSIKLRGSTESFQVLSADASTKHGFRPHGIVFDEFHAQPDRDLFDTLYRGMGKRRQPVLIMITTAGDDDESICAEEWDYARRLIHGSVSDDSYLPIIFELKPEEDWSDQAVLKRVNPGYGITMKADYFVTEVAAAKAEPRKRNSFLQLHGNRWVNQATAWIPVEWWDACKEPLPEDLELATLPCAAGLDLAQKFDLACLSLTFRQKLATKEVVEVLAEQPTGIVVKKTVELNYKLLIVPFFWIPEDTMREREKDDRIPYSLWAKELIRGMPLVQPTEGAIIDYTRIFTDIRDKIAPRFPKLKEGVIGYDPAFATDLATKLRDIAGFKVHEVLQNYSHLSEPSQIFEALVKARRVVHGAHRVLRNHVENVTIRSDDAGRIRPVKPKRTGIKRIDGVVASIMGVKMLATIPDVSFEPTMFFLGGN
jgi:phage terminase large subunit-like protein